MAFFGIPLAKIGVAGLPLIGKAFAVPLIAAVGVPRYSGWGRRCWDYQDF